MPQVLFISESLDSAPTRYRAAAYFDRLRSTGWEPSHIDAGPGLFDRIDLVKAARRADLVVVVRKTFTTPTRLALRASSKLLVLDIDDAVFLRDDGSISGTRARRFAAMAKKCDAVWAGNNYLAEHARQHNRIVTLLPTSVDPAHYQVETKKPDAATDLVWIGSSSTRKYLESIVPTLETAAKKVMRLRLKIVADFNLSPPRLPVLAAPWSADREAIDLASAHIGIAPMPDDPWTRGKCGLKVLQYMAAGLPVVASDAGVHRDIIQHNQTGFLCQSPADWTTAIQRLADDPALRTTIGQAARRHVADHYSVAATSKKMLRALEDLV